MSEPQKKQHTAEQLKADVDAAVDECIAAIQKHTSKYDSKSVQALIQHRVVNYLWFAVNAPVLHAINHQNFLLKESVKVEAAHRDNPS